MLLLTQNIIYLITPKIKIRFLLSAAYSIRMYILFLDCYLSRIKKKSSYIV